MSRATRKQQRPTRESAATLEAEARLAVNLPVHLHRQLKARAAEQGSTIRDYILELLAKDGVK